MVAEIDVTRQRIERREQSILDEDLLRSRQRAQDRRLAGIGIADERCLEFRLARLALNGPPALHVAQPLTQDPNALIDQSAVCLELGFTRTAHADTAAELFQV